MTRVTFTTLIAELIRYANNHDIQVLIDWVLRDAETQHRLYLAGATKCDGHINRSRHQVGKAADIYIIVDHKISDDDEQYNFLHDYWDEIGGGPRIMGDLGHFEG